MIFIEVSNDLMPRGLNLPPALFAGHVLNIAVAQSGSCVQAYRWDRDEADSTVGIRRDV
jgi:hypothetical protein